MNASTRSRRPRSACIRAPMPSACCRLQLPAAQARHPEAEQRAPRLPVRAAAADAEGDWVADVQPRLEALPAVPVVQGITVVDDLAAELERQRQEQEE